MKDHTWLDFLEFATLSARNQDVGILVEEINALQPSGSPTLVRRVKDGINTFFKMIRDAHLEMIRPAPDAAGTTVSMSVEQRLRLSSNLLTVPLPDSLRVPTDLGDDRLAFDPENWSSFIPQGFNPSASLNLSEGAVDAELSGLMSKQTVSATGETRTEYGVVHPWTAASLVELHRKYIQSFPDSTVAVLEALTGSDVASHFQSLLNPKDDDGSVKNIEGPIIRITEEEAMGPTKLVGIDSATVATSEGNKFNLQILVPKNSWIGGMTG